MHLPYIRKLFWEKPITLVPLMVGHVPPEKMDDFAKALAPYFMDPKTLFVVSSDFCHWGKRFKFTHTFSEEPLIYKSISKLDHMGMELIEKQNLKGFQDYLNEYKNTICGRNPICVLLATIEYCEKNKAGAKFETKFIKYAQSSEIHSD